MTLRGPTLDRYESALSLLRPKWLSQYSPGLDLPSFAAQVKKYSLFDTADIQSLYSWRDGVSDWFIMEPGIAPLLDNYRMLPFKDGIRRYEQMRTWHPDCVFLPIAEDPILRSQLWLMLADGSECIGEIHEVEEPVTRFDSMDSMFLTLAVGMETGLLVPDEDFGLLSMTANFARIAAYANPQALQWDHGVYIWQMGPVSTPGDPFATARIPFQSDLVARAHQVEKHRFDIQVVDSTSRVVDRFDFLAASDVWHEAVHELELELEFRLADFEGWEILKDRIDSAFAIDPSDD